MSHKDHKLHTYDTIHATYAKHFKDESDRAAVILAASVLDDALQKLLQQVFVPSPASTDDLFDGPTAPLGSFSSKIEMTYRLGLISARLARDLHLVRRIRNDFAHNVAGCTFANDVARARVAELVRSLRWFMPMYRNEGYYGTGTRGDFCLITSWMIQYLTFMTSHGRPSGLRHEEWAYTKEGCDWAQKDLKRKGRSRQKPSDEHEA